MKRKQGIEYFIIAMLLIFAEWFFFRNVIQTNGLLGDNGDGRLCTMLTEHWYQFFCGKESFDTIRMFYPVENVIGYSDMLLGYGCIHSLFRLLGFNVYVSYKFTLIVVHAVGSAFMYLLLRKQLKVDLGWSMMGVISFSYSIQYSFRTSHTQLIAISMLPVILYFIMLYWHNKENKRRFFYGVTAVTLFVLLMYTAWYIAFFAIVFCLLWAICLLVGVLLRRLWKWCEIKKQICYYWKEAVAYLLYAIVLLIPFMSIYLSQMKVSGPRPWSDVAIYLPELRDYLNVTSNSFLFGGMMEKLPFHTTYETTIGYVLPFILLFVLALVLMLLRRRNVVLTSLAVATLLGALMIVKLFGTSASLWYVIYLLVPGASSIRAVARFAFFLSLPASIVVAVEGNQWTYEEDKTIRYGFAMSLVCFGFWLCNVNKVGVNSYWDADTQLQFVNSVEKPPQDCKVFYVKDSARANRPAHTYQLDAYELAVAFELYTINGYSGQFPADWWGLWDVCSDAYEQNAMSWAECYEISDFYSYDLATNVWQRVR